MNHLIACLKNAVKQVKEISDFISEFNGGDGSDRDFIESYNFLEPIKYK